MVGLQTWDTSQFDGKARAKDMGTDVILEARCWRAHQDPLTSIEWVDPGDFILSASRGSHVSLWGMNGEHIGVFGETTWDTDDRLTWKVPEPQKLEVNVHIFG